MMLLEATSALPLATATMTLSSSEIHVVLQPLHQNRRTSSFDETCPTSFSFSDSHSFQDSSDLSNDSVPGRRAGRAGADRAGKAGAGRAGKEAVAMRVSAFEQHELGEFGLAMNRAMERGASSHTLAVGPSGFLATPHGELHREARRDDEVDPTMNSSLTGPATEYAAEALLNLAGKWAYVRERRGKKGRGGAPQQEGKVGQLLASAHQHVSKAAASLTTRVEAAWAAHVDDASGGFSDSPVFTQRKHGRAGAGAGAGEGTRVMGEGAGVTSWSSGANRNGNGGSDVGGDKDGVLADSRRHQHMAHLDDASEWVDDDDSESDGSGSSIEYHSGGDGGGVGGGGNGGEGEGSNAKGKSKEAGGGGGDSGGDDGDARVQEIPDRVPDRNEVASEAGRTTAAPQCVSSRNVDMKETDNTTKLTNVQHMQRPNEATPEEVVSETGEATGESRESSGSGGSDGWGDGEDSSSVSSKSSIPNPNPSPRLNIRLNAARRNAARMRLQAARLNLAHQNAARKIEAHQRRRGECSVARDFPHRGERGGGGSRRRGERKAATPHGSIRNHYGLDNEALDAIITPGNPLREKEENGGGENSDGESNRSGRGRRLSGSSTEGTSTVSSRLATETTKERGWVDRNGKRWYVGASTAQMRPSSRTLPRLSPLGTSL